MILPTKGIGPQQALITIGAIILKQLERPKTVSRLWDEIRRQETADNSLRFDWFILALDLLYILGAIDTDQGRIRKTSSPNTAAAQA